MVYMVHKQLNNIRGICGILLSMSRPHCCVLQTRDFTPPPVTKTVKLKISVTQNMNFFTLSNCPNCLFSIKINRFCFWTSIVYLQSSNYLLISTVLIKICLISCRVFLPHILLHLSSIFCNTIWKYMYIIYWKPQIKKKFFS